MELATAVDPDIVDRAEAHGLVIVTVDTDFPMLIALRRATSPSIPLLRGVNELAPDDHAALFIANLPAVATDLESGAIVSLGPTTYASQASHWPEGSHRSAGDPVRWFLSTEPIWSLRYEASVGVDRRGD